jgi:hypothetical protein
VLYRGETPDCAPVKTRWKHGEFSPHGAYGCRILVEDFAKGFGTMRGYKHT